MGNQEETVYLVSKDLGDLLYEIEVKDVAPFRTVDLDAYLPTLAEAAPAPKTRQSRRVLANGLTQGSFARKSIPNTPEVSERSSLFAQRDQLNREIEDQLRRIKELQRQKEYLEQQVREQTTRSRMGYRSQSGPLTEEMMSPTVKFWKEKCEDMENKCNHLRDILENKKTVVRMSTGQLRKVATPQAVRPSGLTPTFTTE